jgi:ribosomal protein S18 acetylase RimI-like enzyme
MMRRPAGAATGYVAAATDGERAVVAPVCAPLPCPPMSEPDVSRPTEPTSVGADAQPPVEVSEVTSVTPELVAAFERLVPQLSSSNPPPTADELAFIVDSPASVLLLARDPARDGEIVGSLTLAVFPIPTGRRAWIEDVVVDGESRGRGVGAALNRVALERAREMGAKTVDLTSRPSREAANRLYLRLGFVQRDTNVYRYTL